MLCADEFQADFVTVGKYLTTKKCKYILTEELGRGGYGCVFKVRPDPFDGSEYAMKLEKKRESRPQAKLAMEQHIMRLIRKKPAKQRSHFIDVLDRGKKRDFFFLVMNLVGESIADLKRARTLCFFTVSTTYSAGIQCLEGIRQLHSVGYIHRDIKPENYAIGRGESIRTIYILDFGIARNILNTQNELKAPRSNVLFKGTSKYASLACHKGQEQGKKDDCESWMYMLADMSNPFDVPWNREKNRYKIAAIKENSRTVEGSERTFHGLNVELMKGMLDYLDSLEYADEIDYSFLYETIKMAARNSKINLNAPYDWEESKTTSHT